MKELKQKLSKAFGKKNVSESLNELTLNIKSEDVLEVCQKLKDEFQFEILMGQLSAQLSLPKSNKFVVNGSQTVELNGLCKKCQ